MKQLTLLQMLRRLREKKHISQEYIACKLNVTQATYSRMERGLQPASPEQLKLIAEALGYGLTADEESQHTAEALRLEERNSTALANLTWWKPWKVIAIFFLGIWSMSDGFTRGFMDGYQGIAPENPDSIYGAVIMLVALGVVYWYNPQGWRGGKG